MTETASPLLSCYGKPNRARVLMQELADATRAFRGSKHYKIVRFDNAQEGSDPLVQVQWRVKILQPIPDEWAYLAGDIVNNKRSALDHALAEVARRRLGFTDED